MNNKYYYEYEWDSKYCYPNSYVLKNKLEIEDENDFFTAEREVTSIRLLEITEFPVKGDFNFQHLKDIHKAIFFDVFDWAGKTRTVNISKGNMFCPFQNIEVQAKTVFDELESENYLSDLGVDETAERLAYYLSEINVIHPFREGNGRAQRLFINYLAEKNGYHLDYSYVNPNEMIEASAMSFHADYNLMNSLIRKIISIID